MSHWDYVEVERFDIPQGRYRADYDGSVFDWISSCRDKGYELKGDVYSGYVAYKLTKIDDEPSEYDTFAYMEESQPEQPEQPEQLESLVHPDEHFENFTSADLQILLDSLAFSIQHKPSNELAHLYRSFRFLQQSLEFVHPDDFLFSLRLSHSEDLDKPLSGAELQANIDLVDSLLSSCCADID